MLCYAWLIFSMSPVAEIYESTCQKISDDVIIGTESSAKMLQKIDDTLLKIFKIME